MPAVKKPVKILSIDDILQADDHTTATVDCPEWGGQVEVRSLTRAEVVKAWEDSMDADGVLDGMKFQINLVVPALGLTPDRAAQLNEKHPAPIKRIELKARELSGMSDDDPLG